MERVQYQLERSLPQLQLLDDNHVLTKHQLQQITSQRQLHESRLIRQNPDKVDFIRYAEYEQNLSELISIKAKRLDLSNHFHKQNDTYHSAHIISIWERLVTKFKYDVQAWKSYIAWANARKMRVVVGRVYARALSLHPNNVPLWLAAASHELNNNSSTTAARSLLQQALRLNALPWTQEETHSTAGKRKSAPSTQPSKRSKSSDKSAVASTSTSISGPLKLKLSSRQVDLLRLWVEYFRMELVFIERLRRRWIVLGIQWEGSTETAPMDGDDAEVAAAEEELRAEAAPSTNENEQALLSQVPKADGEGESKNAVETAPNTYTKRAAAGIPEAQLSILRGSIPIFLIGNALKTLPPYLHFILLLSLLELIRNFPLADAVAGSVSRSTSTGTTRSGEALRQRLLSAVYEALEDRPRWGWDIYAPVALVTALRELLDAPLSESEASARDAAMQEELQENGLLEKASRLRESFSEDTDGLLDLAEYVRLQGRGADLALRLVLQLFEAALVDDEGPSVVSVRLAQSGRLPAAIAGAIGKIRPLCEQAPNGDFHTALLMLVDLLGDSKRSAIDEANLLAYLDATRTAVVKSARKRGVETGAMRSAILSRQLHAGTLKEKEAEAATRDFPACADVWRVRLRLAGNEHSVWRQALQACPADEALWASYLDHVDALESKRERQQRYAEAVAETASALSRNVAGEDEQQPRKQEIHDLVVSRYVAFSQGKGLENCLKASFASERAWLGLLPTLDGAKREQVYRHLLNGAPSPAVHLSRLADQLSKHETVEALRTFEAAKATLSASDAHTLEKGWQALL